MCGGERGPRREAVGIGFQRVARDVLGTDAGSDRRARAKVLPHLDERADVSPLDRRLLPLLADDVGAACALTKRLDAEREAGGRRRGEIGLRAERRSPRIQRRVAKRAVEAIVEIAPREREALL